MTSEQSGRKRKGSEERRDEKQCKARLLDQFYTKKDVAEQCVRSCLAFLEEKGINPETCAFFEPSAGSGVFLNAMPFPCRGIDIDPKRDDVEQADFLTWEPGETGIRSRDEGVCVAIGNPPFGRNSSLALRFLNRCSKFFDYTAFILPRTFEKGSMVNRVEEHMHLVHQESLVPDSFAHNGKSHSVPVVFQIWERKGVARRKIQSGRLAHEDFCFVKNPREADFAFQRVGAAAGKVSKDGLEKSSQSHYFLKVKKNASRSVFDVLRGIDWSSVKYRTAGNPSIGKGELVMMYEEALPKSENEKR